MSPMRNLNRTIPVLLLALLPAALFADVFFTGSNFFMRDLYRYYFPMKQAVREVVSQGEFPYWNRAIGGGQPMAANPAYEVFYPPLWLILAGRFEAGFALHILFHVYLALLGMYALLRQLSIAPAAAVAASMSFGLGGFLLGSMSNLPIFLIWSWTGLIGWAVLRYLRNRTKRNFAFAAILLSMPILVAEPMTLVQLGVLVLVGTFLIDRKSLPAVAALGLTVACLAAVQLLPMADFVRDTIRSRGFAYSVVVDYSMPALRPLELFTPHPFGVVDANLHTFRGMKMYPRGLPYFLSLYCGLFTAVFACGGLFARIRGSLTFLALAVVSYVLAIGPATPLFRVLYALGLHSIRYPEKFIAMAIVPMVLFAAVSANRFLSGDEGVRRGSIVAALAIVVAALIAAYWIPPGRTGFLTTAALGTAWAFLLWRKSTVVLAGLALLLLDILPVANETAPRMPHEFFTPPAVARALGEGTTLAHRGEWLIQDPDLRQFERVSHAWLERNGVRPYTAASWGLRGVLEPDIDETFLLPTHDLLDAFKQSAGADRIIALTGADYVVDWRSFDDAKRGNPEVTHMQPIVLRKIAEGGTYRSSARILSVQETPNTATIRVDAAVPSTLQMLVTRHKYWHVTIDGREATVAPANIAFQSVNIPQGTHTVAMVYRNPLIGWGAAVSLITLVVLLFQLPRRASGKTHSRQSC